jgi:hypothetical protein
MAALTVTKTGTYSGVDDVGVYASASNEYRVVISAALFGTNERYFELDMCKVKEVNASSQISTRPVQNGMVMADHMYNNPDEVSLSGAFSLNGRAVWTGRDCFTVANVITDGNPAVSDGKIGTQEIGILADFGSADRLTRIQETFEFIKRNGILCTITMMSGGSSGSGITRFRRRSSLVLTSIKWTEGYNSMTYDLQFREVMQIDLQMYETDLTHEDLYPSPDMPASKSLTEMLQDNGMMSEEVVKLLYMRGYIDKKDGGAFCYAASKAGWKDAGNVIGNYLKTEAIAAVLIAASAAVISALGFTGVVTAFGLSAAIFPVGTIIAGVALAGIGIYAFVKKLIEDAKKRDRLAKGFNLIQNYLAYIDDDFQLKTGVDPSNFVVNTGDIERLKDLLSAIQSQVSSAISDVTVYQLSVSQTDNTPFTAAIMIGDDLVYLLFTKNNGDDENPWSIQVKDGLGADAKDVSLATKWGVVSDLGDCSRYTNAFYIDSSRQYEAYIVGSGSLNSTKEADTATSETLCSHYIVVSEGSIQEKMATLADTIKSALESQGFAE